ncbi:MAG TPA: hypothetical protein VGN18_10605 [Jatrophihabitans sp.]|jgi:hypothetical protein|uniref:hypothetical protein n=1 Tax=Jatrophihabitans sp. TaxID=1932789 RepID=UPI002E049D6F|nr:hypothetical protein [Jatrophihabitans sp.]
MKTRMVGRPLRARIGAVALVAVAAAASGCTSSRTGHGVDARAGSRAAVASGSTTPGATGSKAPTTRHAPVFAIYYLWWDHHHWTSHLGSAYPVTAPAPPLPATLDASGCGTVNRFAGNVETDISPGLAYDQDNPATIVRDVRLAAAAGLAGFIVNWVGSGAAVQSPTSTSLNRRLGYVFAAVHQVNAAGTPFRIILNYQSSARHLTPAQFTNDFAYYLSRYGDDPALDHTFSPRPEVVMAGTWKYSDADLAAVSRAMRSRMYLLGDEKPSTWDAAREQYLDGTSYYWSSQNPVRNSTSFATLQRFAAKVRAVRNPDGHAKTWLAPFTPGYNAMLLYGTKTCVPRDDGRTLRTLFDGNASSHPDGWTLISWNEITEGTYVVPLTRYGSTYVDDLTALLR